MVCVTCGLPWLPCCYGYNRAWFASGVTTRISMLTIKLQEKRRGSTFEKCSAHDTSTRDRCRFLDCFTLEDGTYMLSRNVLERLPIYAAQNLARWKSSSQVIAVIRRYMTWDVDSHYINTRHSTFIHSYGNVGLATVAVEKVLSDRLIKSQLCVLQSDMPFGRSVMLTARLLHHTLHENMAPARPSVRRRQHSEARNALSREN